MSAELDELDDFDAELVGVAHVLAVWHATSPEVKEAGGASAADVDDFDDRALADALETAGITATPGTLDKLREHLATALPIASAIEAAPADGLTAEQMADLLGGGTLHDYATGERLREATRAEHVASLRASMTAGGVGVIEVDGRRCYVLDF